MSGLGSRLKKSARALFGRENSEKEIHKMATQDAYRLATDMFEELIIEEWQDEYIDSLKVEEELSLFEWLRSGLVIGRANIITGLPDTGKTNLFFIMAELALDYDWVPGINIKSKDPRIHFYKTKRELLEFLRLPQPKLIGFDDAAIYASSRRSGTNVAEFFRALHVAARKPVPDNPEIQGGAIVWLTQDPEIINIDFRERFTAWQYHKPSVELMDAAKIAHKKGKVPLEVKKVLWAYYLVRRMKPKSTKTELRRQLIFWTDLLPATKLDYEQKMLGEFYLDEPKSLEMSKTATYPHVKPDFGDLKVTLVSEAVDIDAAVKTLLSLSNWYSPKDVALLSKWLDGEPQRALHVQTGTPQTTISFKIRQMRGLEPGPGSLGFAFENVWALKYPEYKKGGLNTPDPDSLDEKNRVVYSLKCFCDIKLNLAFAVKAIAESELALMREGWTLFLVILEMFTKTMRMYKIEDAGVKK